MSWFDDAWNNVVHSPLTPYVAGGLGAVAGFFAGGPVGAVVGATFASEAVSGTQNAIKNQEDAQTQQGFAQSAANAAAAQAELEKQNQAMAWDQTQRQLAAEAAQRDIQVSQTNASAKKGAVDAYQAESAGTAALAGSGVAPGSTPYAALEASANENQRSLKDWWSNASQSINLAGLRGVTMDQNAQMNWQSSDLQQSSLLRQKTQYDWQASKYAEAGSDLTLGLNITGSVIQAASDAFSMYTNAGALDIMAKKAGDTGMSLGSVIRDAPQLKYAQTTGDYSYFAPTQTAQAAPTQFSYSGFQPLELPSYKSTFSVPQQTQFTPDFNLGGSMSSFKKLSASPLRVVAGL